MSDIDVVLEGRAFVDGEIRYTEVGISEEGRIVAAGNYVSGGERRVELGTSQIMVPAFIDPHVHFRDPGMTAKEDFGTGTMAAVHAGVSCVFDMPNTKPPAVDVRTFQEKKAIVGRKAVTDYGLFAAVTAGINARMLAPLAVGFKLFMGSTTGNILLDDDEEMIPAVRDVLATGLRMSVHAEDDHLIAKGDEKCCRDHLRNRPVAAETTAISRLAEHFRGSNINICHLPTPEGLDLAKAAGFTAEVTLHHLLFEVDRCPGAEYKVNPPIRDIGTRDALFKRFVSGGFDMIGTDHAPHTAEEKARDFQDAPSGIPGVETTMPMIMEMVRRGTIPLSEAVRMGSYNPGRLFGVSKGAIAEGYDADIAVFDMRETSKIDVRRLHSRCGHSPYAGSDAVFPQDVMIRGSLQVREGEFCGEPIGRDVRGLRDRLFRSGRETGGMSARVRDVLSLSARGAARRTSVLQEEPPLRSREVPRSRTVHRPGIEEGKGILRVPQRPQVLRVPAPPYVLPSVPVPPLRQRQAPGRTGPLVQGGMDREGRQRPR